MEKVIDLNKTVFELCNEDPAIKDILADSGFTDITNRECFKRRQVHDNTKRSKA